MTDAEIDELYRLTPDRFSFAQAVAKQAIAEALISVSHAVAAERERIADLWAGCTTEAEGHGLVDIGLSIREGRLVDAL